jgi:predicted dehydrogenase
MATTQGNPVRVGLVGCGNISAIYLQNSARFPSFDIVACADLIPERAAARAAEYGVAKSGPVDEILADPEIDLILNLTIPAAHAEVAYAAVAAGKSVYNEKPLAVDLADGQQLVSKAKEAGVLVGCAPDTFLGGGLQTCRRLIDEGAIGEPVAATAFMLGHGPESWHPDPVFFYQYGAGPLFDMGPYYITALVSLLGPIRRVTGSARASFAERTIGSEPKKGEKIQVNVPTHSAGVLDFASGPIATLVTSFDIWARTTTIEIHGSEASMAVPDPNTFGGPVKIRKPNETEWTEVPLTHGNTDNSRGIGLNDLAAALIEQRPYRASGDLALHVLETMHAIHSASTSGHHIQMTTTVDRPEPLP